MLPQGLGVAVYQTPDPRAGCPPRAGANTVLIQRSFSVPCESAAVLARAHMIRNARGTSDLRLAVDSKEVDRALTYTSQGQWEDAAVFWAGVMTRGEHNVKIFSPNANMWGCGPTFGDLDVLVLNTGLCGGGGRTCAARGSRSGSGAIGDPRPPA